MEIYILRHGKAEDRARNITSDAKRQLTFEGKKELESISKAITKFDLKIDTIISSPLVRAKETANILAKHLWKKKKEVMIWDELKPESDISDVHKKIVKLNPDKRIVLVGHEPHLTDLISSIISPNCRISISLKKGGFASIRVKTSESKLTGDLRSILTPKQLKLCK